MLFYKGLDGSASYMTQTSINQGFTGPTSLGGTLTSSPVLTLQQDGRVIAATSQSDGQNYHAVQTTVNGAMGSWVQDP